MKKLNCYVGVTGHGVGGVESNEGGDMLIEMVRGSGVDGCCYLVKGAVAVVVW